MDNQMIETYSAQETHEFGQKIGQQLSPGSVLTLVGDLGVGKTVFSQGLAEGLGITEPVNSPTFTIIQIYEEEDYHSIILMCTGLAIFLKWMKSGMRIISGEMGFA